MIYKRRQFFRNLSLGASAWPWPLSPFRPCPWSREGGRFAKAIRLRGEIIRHRQVQPRTRGSGKSLPQSGRREKLGNRGRREGPLVDAALADHKLPEKLVALETLKDRLTVIQSLSGVGFRGNHTKGFGTLSLHDSEKVAIAPTLDCLLGQHLSTGPYPMYGMAMNGQLLEGGWKPKTPIAIPTFPPTQPPNQLPIKVRPRKLFSNSSAAVTTPEQLEKKIALNGNLMDFLTEDARRVEKQLSGDDKERFALYMDSFDSLRKIEQKKAALTDRIQKHAPERTDRYDSISPQPGSNRTLKSHPPLWSRA